MISSQASVWWFHGEGNSPRQRVFHSRAGFALRLLPPSSETCPARAIAAIQLHLSGRELQGAAQYPLCKEREGRLAMRSVSGFTPSVLLPGVRHFFSAGDIAKE